MTCFPDGSTYATLDVSIVLGIIITSVMILFLSWHLSKGKKKLNHYLEAFEALLGGEGCVFFLYTIKISIGNKGEQSTLERFASVLVSKMGSFCALTSGTEETLRSPVPGRVI